MGNICRSPTAEGVFRKEIEDAGLAKDFFVDSAGTHSYHVGKPADARAIEAAACRGYDLSRNIGRQVSKTDLTHFDYVLAMDRQNYNHLQSMAGGTHDGKISLFLNFAPELGAQDVPDPYFGGNDGFEYVLDIIQTGSKGLLESIRRKHTT